MPNQQNNAADNSGPLEPIERALANFSPAAPRIDRDRLMFLAGQASMKGPDAVCARPGAQWFWPASTAALAATSLALAFALFVRPVAGPQIVYVERPAAIDTSPHKSEKATNATIASVSAWTSKTDLTLPSDNYVRTREVALRMGLDAIGAPRAGGPTTMAAPTYGNLLHSLDAAPSRSPDTAPWIETLLNM